MMYYAENFNDKLEQVLKEKLFLPSQVSLMEYFIMRRTIIQNVDAVMKNLNEVLLSLLPKNHKEQKIEEIGFSKNDYFVIVYSKEETTVLKAKKLPFKIKTNSKKYTSYLYDLHKNILYRVEDNNNEVKDDSFFMNPLIEEIIKIIFELSRFYNLIDNCDEIKFENLFAINCPRRERGNNMFFSSNDYFKICSFAYINDNVEISFSNKSEEILPWFRIYREKILEMLHVDISQCDENIQPFLYQLHGCSLPEYKVEYHKHITNVFLKAKKILAPLGYVETTELIEENSENQILKLISEKESNL